MNKYINIYISLKASRLEKDCLQHWVPLNPWRACFHNLSFIYTLLFYIRYVYVCFMFGMIKIFAVSLESGRAM